MSVTRDDATVYVLERALRYPYPSSVPTLAENLKARALKFGGPTGLAKKLGRHTSTVSDVLNAKEGTISVARLLKYATALQTPVEELIAGVDPAYDAMRSDLGLHTSRVQRSGASDPNATDATTARLLAEQQRKNAEVLATLTDAVADLATIVVKHGRPADVEALATALRQPDRSDRRRKNRG